MSKLRFIRTSDASALQAVEWRGDRVIESFARIKAFLEARGESALGNLFAEPLLGGNRDKGIRSIAWYTTLEGDSVHLAEADAGQRQAAEHQLADALQRLTPSFADATLGPLLQRAFLVASEDDISLIGGQVVLTNWGLVPPPVAETDAACRVHFAATLGRYTDIRLPLDTTAAPPAPVGNPAPPVPPDAPLLAGTQRGRRGGIANEGTALPPEPAVAGTAARIAWYQQPWAWALSGVLILLCGILIGLMLHFAGAAPSNRNTTDLVGLQDEVNRSLEDQIARLRKTLDGDVCTVDDPLALLAPAQKPILPPQGETPKPVGPTAEQQPSKQTLAQRLEETAVFVLVPASDGLSTGTGFLVAPGVILTNSHVVRTATQDNPVYVTSKALGGLHKAQIAVATSPSEVMGAPDFAILKLPPEITQKIQPLPITGEIAKLDPVVAAGFPGFELKVDPNFFALLKKGESSAVPDVVVSSGEVSVIRSLAAGTSVIAHTAVVSQGNSGGPLVDRCGRVVGINTFIRIDDQSLRQGNYALGGNDIIGYLKQNQIPVVVSAAKCSAGAAAAAAATQ